MNAAVAYVHEQLTGKKDFPKFKAGDNITVNYKIIEGNKERIQQFQGVVLYRRGTNTNGETFSVRKVSNGVGVERIFPLHAPSIDRIEVVSEGVVRQSRIYYLRNLKGKAARIKTKKSW